MKNKHIVKIAHKEWHRLDTDKNRNIEIEIGELPLIGWIRIKEIGQENIYFTADGTVNGKAHAIACFCKVA